MKLPFSLPAVWETERLRLRPWREDDAAALYRYASDPAVGPAAGWTVHTSEAESLEILRAVLMNDATWALTRKGSDEPVGSIGVFPTRCSAADGEPEIGYWIARPLWGNGYMPEAVRRLISLCFEQGAAAVWCAHFPENNKSRRVIEKCGFVYQMTEDYTGSDGITRKSRYYKITKNEDLRLKTEK